MGKLIAGAVALFAATALITTAYANHAFGPHWKPRTVTVVDATNYSADLQAVIDAWNQLGSIQLVREVGPCRRQNGKIVVCSGTDFNGPSFSAWTEYDTQRWRWQDGINALHFRWVQIFAREDSIFTAYDWQRKHVFCHELGHGLGLDHNPNPSPGCMGAGSSDVESRSYPDAHDYETLVAIYNHAD